MLLKQYSDGVEILSVNENQLREVLYEISSRIKTEHQEVKEIILFGSLIKKEFLPSSDIDIAIIVNKTDKKFIERLEEFLDYFSMIPFDINLVVYTMEEKEKMLQAKYRFVLEIVKGEKLIS